MKLIEFINLGGPLNWVLAAILCFCFCQCLERGIYFFQTRKDSKNDVLKRLQAKAATLSELPKTQQQKELIKESTLLYYEMNRGLWLLNVISAVSPSIGLLGTVTGLIGSFSKMAEVGAGSKYSRFIRRYLGSNAHNRIRDDHFDSRAAVLPYV